MGKLAGFKYKQIVKKMQKFGFVFLRQAKGSHEIWYNETKNIYVTIPKHGKDMAEFTLQQILKQSQINVKDFLNKK